MVWKQCMEAGKLPASLLMVVTALLTACGAQVSSTPNSGDTLSCPDFETNVFPVLTTPINGKTCSASGCHYIDYTTGSGGTTGGGFKIDPSAMANAGSPLMERNYLAALGFTDFGSAANSRLLLKPLADPSVGGHGGGVVFTSTSDINYLVLLGWINNRIQGPSSCP